jgi:DNA-binding beta-propeller fold protein YncE
MTFSVFHPEIPVRNPFISAFDGAQNCYTCEAESNANQIRIIESSASSGKTHVLLAVPGPGEALVALAISSTAKRGPLYVANRRDKQVLQVDIKTGKFKILVGPEILKEPHDLCLDNKSNSLLIADVSASILYRLDLKTKALTPIAGTGKRQHTGDNGPATEASIAGARAIAIAPDGTIYLCEREGNCIRKIDVKTNIITTIAGTGKKEYTGDGGPALEATFNGPKGICVGKNGDVLVVDTENHALRKIDAKTSTITTLVAGLNRPHGVCVHPEGGYLIGDSQNHRLCWVK